MNGDVGMQQAKNSGNKQLSFWYTIKGTIPIVHNPPCIFIIFDSIVKTTSIFRIYVHSYISPQSIVIVILYTSCNISQKREATTSGSSYSHNVQTFVCIR